MGFFSAIFVAIVAAYTIKVVFVYGLHFYDRVNQGQSVPSLSEYIPVVLVEWWFGLASMLLIPFGYLPPRSISPKPDGGPPLLLLHGYSATRGTMFTLYWRFRQAGYENVHAPNIVPTMGDMDTLAQTVATHVRRLHQAFDQPVIVVAHSMGAIAARRAMQLENDLPIKQLLALGAPHHGSRLAYFGLGGAAKSIRPNTELLRGLEGDEQKVVSFYSAMDPMISPTESAVYGVKSVEVDDLGHEGLIHSQRFFAAILEHLRALRS